MPLLVALTTWVGCKGGCQQPAKPAVQSEAKPTLRIYVIGGVAGAIEPCGCVKDMLGGVDHAAAFVESGQVPRLLLGAGPMFFMDPKLEERGRQQHLFKAEALAESFRELKLTAWAPGQNDWAGGAEEFQRLREKSGASALAANLDGSPATRPITVQEVAGIKVGVAGVSEPKSELGSPAGLEIRAPEQALREALKQLDQSGAKLKIALLALPRGQALRLAEKVPGFQLLVVGKPTDRGEGNDAPTPAVVIEKTLVVEVPNHLQAVAVLDLHVRGDDFEFQDATGLKYAETRLSLESRIHEIEARVATWDAHPEGVKADDVAARKLELVELKRKLAKLKQPETPTDGSYFRYDLTLIREKLGVDPGVKQRLAAYYRKVNQHNLAAFKDKLPEPAGEGQSGYLGVAACGSCHTEELKFWKTTRHAGAYKTLADQDKQYNLDCASCHVTGYDKPGGSTLVHVDKLSDVQCEVCHGPGSRHPNDPANPEFILKKPAESACAPACHHPPHVKQDWDVKQAWKRILGKGHGG